MSPDARQEIKDQFAECCDPQFAATSARYIPQQCTLVRKLAARHQANGKPLCDGRAPADAPV